MVERLGVLVVHGIGEQRRGSSVRQAADALARALRPHATVTLAGVDVDPDADRERPAHLEILLERDGDAARWLLAESWWARAFQPPTFREVLRWAWRVAPGLLAVEAWRRRENNAFTWSGQLTLLLAPLTVTLLVLLVVLSALPVGRVRALVGRVQVALTGTIGDSAVLDDGVLGSAIASRVVADLEWLARQPGVVRIVVLAHSQGAAIAHRVLRERPAVATPLDLVTFGSGLDKLTIARRLDEAGPVDRARLTVAGVLSGLGVLGTIVSMNLASPWFLPALLGIGIAASALALLLRAISRRVRKFMLPGALLFLLALCLLAAVRLGRGAPPALALLFGGSLLVYYVGERLLRDAVRDVRPDPLPAVRTWYDVRSVNDPVPSPEAPVGAVPVLVHNTGSVLRDHTTYWSNGEEFLPFVLRTLGVPAAAPKPPVARATVLALAQAIRFVVVGAGAAAVRGAWDQLPALGNDVAGPVLRVLARVPLVDLPSTLAGEDRWAARAVGAFLVLLPALAVARAVRISTEAALARRGLRSGW
ncbi:MAG TPA: hypothetical protein VNA20_10655 [Frankiaceae bacterium]|nr:hypothetical protein [Frankiaceae bacterium]